MYKNHKNPYVLERGRAELEEQLTALDAQRFKEYYHQQFKAGRDESLQRWLAWKITHYISPVTEQPADYINAVVRDARTLHDRELAERRDLQKPEREDDRNRYFDDSSAYVHRPPWHEQIYSTRQNKWVKLYSAGDQQYQGAQHNDAILKVEKIEELAWSIIVSDFKQDSKDEVYNYGRGYWLPKTPSRRTTLSQR